MYCSRNLIFILACRLKEISCLQAWLIRHLRAFFCLFDLLCLLGNLVDINVEPRQRQSGIVDETDKGKGEVVELKTFNVFPSSKQHIVNLKRRGKWGGIWGREGATPRPFCISNATSPESRFTWLIPEWQKKKKEQPLSVNLQMKPFSIIRAPFVMCSQMTAFPADGKHRQRHSRLSHLSII